MLYQVSVLLEETKCGGVHFNSTSICKVVNITMSDLGKAVFNLNWGVCFVGYVPFHYVYAYHRPCPVASLRSRQNSVPKYFLPLPDIPSQSHISNTSDSLSSSIQ